MQHRKTTHYYHELVDPDEMLLERDETVTAREYAEAFLRREGVKPPKGAYK